MFSLATTARKETSISRESLPLNTSYRGTATGEGCHLLHSSEKQQGPGLGRLTLVDPTARRDLLPQALLHYGNHLNTTRE